MRATQMPDILVGALIAAVATLIAAIAGWVSQLIAGRTLRTQWLAEKRHLAYFEFYNSWESAKNLITKEATDQLIDEAFDAIYVCARGIDLLGGASTRSAAWSSVERLNDFRRGDCSLTNLRIEINACLNVLKRDLGISQSIHS
jgi:hypothetical protein